MTAPRSSRTSSYEHRMLTMADRLFTEFDDLPVATVFRAIGAARSEVRDSGDGLPPPERVEAVARNRLLGCLEPPTALGTDLRLVSSVTGAVG